MIYLLVFILMSFVTEAQEKYFYCDDEIPDCWCFPYKGTPYQEEFNTNLDAMDTCDVDCGAGSTFIFDCNNPEYLHYCRWKNYEEKTQNIQYAKKDFISSHLIGIFSNPELGYKTVDDISDDFENVKDYYKGLKDILGEFILFKSSTAFNNFVPEFECLAHVETVLKLFNATPFTKEQYDGGSNNPYSFGHRKNYQYGPLGVKDKQNAIEVYYEGGLLTINNSISQTRLIIVDQLGSVIYNVTTIPKAIQINLNNGLYLVKIGHTTHKLLIIN